MKQILAEEKQLLKKSNVVTRKVPQYEELSVKALWPQVQGDEDVSKYFPDQFAVGKGPGRDYFFNVLNTVQPDFLNQIISHANKQRMSADGEIGQREAIKISQFWEEQLKLMPYNSSKCYLNLRFNFVFNV